MARLLVRIILLAIGLGVTEIGLVGAVGSGAPMGWAAVAVGLLLVVAGSAGFMVPLLGGGPNQGGAT